MLGIADMLGTDVTITSTDPHTGAPILVDIRDGDTSWSPPTTVVIAGSDTTAGDGCCPDDADTTVPAVDRCCHVMNFFAETGTAQAWLDNHPTVAGTVLSKEQALQLGVEIFGQLLND